MARLGSGLHVSSVARTNANSFNLFEALYQPVDAFLSLCLPDKKQRRSVPSHNEDHSDSETASPTISLIHSSPRLTPLSPQMPIKGLDRGGNSSAHVRRSTNNSAYHSKNDDIKRIDKLLDDFSEDPQKLLPATTLRTITAFLLRRNTIAARNGMKIRITSLFPAEEQETRIRSYRSELNRIQRDIYSYKQSHILVALKTMFFRSTVLEAELNSKGPYHHKHDESTLPVTLLSDIQKCLKTCKGLLTDEKLVADLNAFNTPDINIRQNRV